MSQPVILVASGDLRPAANQLCWPAQKAVEEAVSEQIRRLGHEVRRGHPIDAEKGHGFIDSQRYGMEVFRRFLRTRRSSSSRPCGSTATTSCPGCSPTRADPHRRQLERRVARPRRHAEPERLAHQGRREVQHSLERRFHRRVLPRRSATWLDGRLHSSTTISHVQRSSDLKLPEGRSSDRARTRPAAASATRRSWASSTRAAWGCTTPSSPMSSCIPRACSRSG